MRNAPRRRFDEEFRREAVRLAESGTVPMAQIARELGVHVETLRLWRVKARTRAEAPDSDAPGPSLEDENRRLRRENARLVEEREILKKAMAFFAKDAR
jgi:transposase